METTFYLKQLIFPILLSLPHFLVIVVGMGLSVFKYKTYPKTSLLSIFGLLILAILRVLYIIQPVFNIWMMDSKIDTETFSYIITGINVFTSIFGTIALAILIFAIWSNRNNE